MPSTFKDQRISLWSASLTCYELKLNAYKMSQVLYILHKHAHMYVHVHEV